MQTIFSVTIKHKSSWLTVSNQIFKSLSLCYKKSYFFKMVQPIDLLFCKMIEIVEQNFFNHTDFFYLGPEFLFLAKSIFSADDVTHVKSGNPMQNQRNCYFSFVFSMSLTKLCKPSETALRQLFDHQFCVLSLNDRMTLNSAVSHEVLAIEMIRKTP